jgi:hypothetical protein
MVTLSEGEVPSCTIPPPTTGLDMMRRVLSLAAFSLVAIAATGTAQRTSRMPVETSSSGHDGFTMSFGLGNGSAGVTCSTCATDRENGLSGFLSMGGAVSPTLVFGGELNGWSKSKNGADSRIGFLTGYAQWYPSATNGFFVKPGLGMGSISIQDNTTVPSNKLESAGFAYQIGAGYDFRMSHTFSLTPYANYIATTGASSKFNGVDTGDKLNTNNFQIGIGLTWH